MVRMSKNWKLSEFFKKNSGIDFGHFGPCFEQQTQNRVFFAQQGPYAFVGQKVVKSGQNRPGPIFS